MLSRRGFLSWFLGFLLLVAGCAPRKPAPKPNPAPAAPPPPAPPPPHPPAPKPAAPLSPPASRSDILLTTNQEENARALQEKTGMIQDLVNGKRGNVQISTPTKPLTMEYRGNQVSRSKHLILNDDKRELNFIPDSTGFVFKDETGRTLVDEKGAFGRAGQPLRLGLAQLQEALRNPDKLRGLFQTGTKILIIALVVWLGAKIGLIVLAALAWLAFLGILIGLAVMTVGPAIRTFKALLAQAGIDEKDLAGFLKKAGEIAKAVIAESISELRKLPQFAQ